MNEMGAARLNQRRPVRRRRGTIGGALVLFMSALSSIVVASTSGAASLKASAAAAHAKSGGALTVEFIGPPISMNPELGGTAYSLIFTLGDYDPLIYLDYHGKYEPDLATSWGYVGSGNKAFNITLRKGVRFTDGSLLTANAEKASLLYDKKGPNGVWLASVGNIKVLSKYELQIDFSSPDPSAPYIFTQMEEVGFPIGPRGIADPSSLATESDGAGQFELKPSGVIPNVSYTFVRNPRYWNPSAVHWKSFVIKVIGPSPSTIFSAISTKQVMFAAGSASTAASAASANLKIFKAPFVIWALYLLDRSDPSSPLSSVKVRQAINYALNRPALNRALNGTSAGLFGVATDEPAVPGEPGYVKADANAYPYNPQKAKALLAAAGYPHGFTLNVADSGLLDVNGAIGTAVGSELGAIGIKVNPTLNSAGIPQFESLSLSKQYPAIYWGFSAQNPYVGFLQSNAPGTFTNPFSSTESKVSRYLAQSAGKKNGSLQQAQFWQKAVDRLTKEAWYAPLFLEESLYYAQPNLKNIHANLKNNVPDPFAPTSTGGWHLG